MSTEFLNNRLFRPFQQEDDLSQGTGLGMSLVSKLVDGLGGNVEVQTLKGCGTTITISIPLDDRIQNQNDTTTSKPCQGVRIGFVERSSVSGKEAHTVGRKLLRDTLEHACRRLGTEITSPDVAEIQMVFEVDVQGVEVHEPGSPMIVLCDSFVTAHRLRKSFEVQGPRRHIECIAEPYGPIRLDNAIQACIESTTNQNSINGDLGDADRTRVPLPARQTTAHSDLAMPLDERQDHILENSASAKVARPITEAGRQPSRTRSNDATPKGRPQTSRPSASPRRVTTDSSDMKPPVEAKNKDVCLLLVDDNTVNLRMLVAYAKRYDYHYFSAMNGLEAVEVYEKATLPPVNGEETKNSKAIVVLLDINVSKPLRHLRHVLIIRNQFRCQS